ncbi:MAG: hypothetical protein LBI10_01530 [Deltaproteobacteria bacterium]|jgi:hypothetical protein|nr:hypothetical protein [Deltaproteobacteria bacterium]
MSPISHRQLCFGLIAWLAVVAIIVQVMGPAEPRRLMALAPPPKMVAKVKEPTPEPVPEPAPVVVATDELADFRPCVAKNNPQSQGKGEASFGDFRFHYDDQGRFVLLAPYAGVIGDLTLREDLSPPKPVTALDFRGSHKLVAYRLTVTDQVGPVTAILWGQHPGFTRLSVNYDPTKPPKKAALEALCRPKEGGGGLFAARLAFSLNEAPSTSAVAFAISR